MNDATIIASRYVISILTMFLLGCMLGYGLEVLFRRYVSAKKWVNPGFMKGPWLPLYGFGIVLMFLFSGVLYENAGNMILFNPTGEMFGNKVMSGPTIYDLIPLSIIWVSLILLEFIAGLIFVKGFKVRLWDYSNLRGNILGIICPQFSLIWLFVDVVYYYALGPWVFQMFEIIFRFMFETGSNGTMANIIAIFILGIAYGIMLIDFITSVNLFNKIRDIVKNSPTIQRYEQIKEEAKKKAMQNKLKLLEKLPESLKKKDEERKEKQAAFKETKFYKTVMKIIFIDPDKRGAKNNYDEEGRPLKDD